VEGSGGQWNGVLHHSLPKPGARLTLFGLPMKFLTTLIAFAMITASAFAADGPIRHVVHFKFKADASKEQIAKIVEEFAALKDKISVVEALEWGTNVSPEGLDKGYNYCWIVTFKNAADRDTYLVHPAHKAFVELLKPSLEEALVVDFTPQK
jgi:Stress responsive A/B Barrel Domain